jgi:hypothetical protein
VALAAIDASTTPIEVVDFMRDPRVERHWFTLAGNRFHLIPIAVVVAAIGLALARRRGGARARGDVRATRDHSAS